MVLGGRRHDSTRRIGIREAEILGRRRELDSEDGILPRPEIDEDDVVSAGSLEGHVALAKDDLPRKFALSDGGLDLADQGPTNRKTGRGKIEFLGVSIPVPLNLLPGCALLFLLDLVRPHDDVEVRRRQRLANSEKLHFDTEESDFTESVLVQPLQSSEVLVVE
ncbi:MAG: hypothetical protein ACXVRZ_04495 [Gaiellaceae bacterium]